MNPIVDNSLISWLKSNVVAICMAVIAICSLAFNILQARKNRAKIEIKYLANRDMTDQKLFDISKKYMIIFIINHGLKPISILFIGCQYYNSKIRTLDSSKKSRKEQRPIIDERNPSVEYIVEQSLVNLNDVEFFFATDATQKSYQHYTHRFNWFWKRYRLLKDKFKGEKNGDNT